MTGHEHRWALRVISGPMVGAVLPVALGQTVLGRVVRPGDVDLRDDSISRRHAIVVATLDQISITDAGSTNGTFVNGRPATGAVTLNAGDRIGIGESELVVEGEESTERVGGMPPERHAPGEEPSLLTILFTDLVESTRMAHSLGDDTAVRMLGIHDRVVRQALQAHAGREVKHTGDGIMAAFTSPAGGVQAAMDIMRHIEHHNADAGQPALRIRIGLNAGEPLVSGGDLFGLAVSLAARLCEAAEPGTILASEAVRVLCLGKGKRFEDRGQSTFKGIETPVSVCRVIWKE